MSLCRYYGNTKSPSDLVLAEISDSVAEKIIDNKGKSNLSTTDVKKRSAAAQQEECIPSRIAELSSSTAETRVNTEGKLSKVKKESQKKKQRKVDLSKLDNNAELDGNL